MANTKIAGDWCQKQFTDFNAVMTISDQGDILRATVGVKDGETFGFERGFISVGASNIEMQLSGQPIAVFDVKLKKANWLKRRDTLKIQYADGVVEIFKSCTLDWKPIKN